MKTGMKILIKMNKVFKYKRDKINIKNEMLLSYIGRF